MFRCIAAAAIAILFVTSPASADDTKKKDKKNKGVSAFEQLDKNEDGFVSKEEFAARQAKKGAEGKGAKAGEKVFKVLDANSDGKLSKDEFAKIGEKKKKKDKA